MVITWNENFRKLTTSDQPRTRLVVGIGCGPWRLEMHLLGRAGMASSLCWMLHRGIWFEDLLQHRSTVERSSLNIRRASARLVLSMQSCTCEEMINNRNRSVVRDMKWSGEPSSRCDIQHI